MRLLPLVLLLALAAPALACFGPKLYIGTGSEERDQVLTALVAIYIHEKTGVEVVRQPLEDQAPVAAIRAAKVDFAFASTSDGLPVLLSHEGLLLLGGPRLADDLQFTTVLPAIERLAGQLAGTALAPLQQAVADGALPMAVARRFLLENGWI